MYFVIYFAEDGIEVLKMSRTRLLETLQEITARGDDEVNFINLSTEVRYSMDSIHGDYPLGKYAIIEGDCIFPQKVQVVTKYTLPS